MTPAGPSFELLGGDPPASPVILSVPHAGRVYPLPLRANLRVAPVALTTLEDRHVDAVALAARSQELTIVQRLARAWIDLNRDEDERDPAVDEGARHPLQPATSAKLRNGLGLVPRRASGGDIWRRPFPADDIAARIVGVHRPYHAALRAALLRARIRFGVAVLLDIHSMPPLAGRHPPQIVLGDRFGVTAAHRFVHRLEAEAAAGGVATALNAPYAGGHLIARHGDPENRLHAVQIEIDRALYLDRGLDRTGAGLAATAALLRRMIAGVADEALGGSTALAAE